MTRGERGVEKKLPLANMFLSLLGNCGRQTRSIRALNLTFERAWVSIGKMSESERARLIHGFMALSASG
jgi:hypothetical protein